MLYCDICGEPIAVLMVKIDEEYYIYCSRDNRHFAKTLKVMNNG